jgi:hypothetical protein
MAKRKPSKLAAGAAIRVRDGVLMPEFAELPIGGWSGRVVESTGSGDKLKYIVEWDAPTQDRIPDAYKQQCESQGLCTDMACLVAADVEAVEPE